MGSRRPARWSDGAGWSDNDSKGGPTIYNGHRYPSQEEAEAAEAADDAAAKKEESTFCDVAGKCIVLSAAAIIALNRLGFIGGKNKTKRKKIKRKRRRITSSRRSYP